MVEAPTLFSNPIKTLYLFSIVLFNYAKDAVKYLSKFWHIIGFLTLVVVAPRFVEGEHSEVISKYINSFSWLDKQTRLHILCCIGQFWE